MEKLFSLIRGKTVQNGVWMYLLQFFNAVVPLLTLPYITRVLGTERYGVFTVALNLVMYLQVVVEYGFNLSATRKVALRGREALDKTFSAVLFARLLLLGLCVLFSAAYGAVHLLYAARLSDAALADSFALVYSLSIQSESDF